MANITTPAAVRMSLRHPFWCELFYSMAVVEDSAVGTAATDGKSLWVSPKFWGALPAKRKSGKKAA